MTEGQQVPLTAAPIVLPAVGLTSLSVLANVRQTTGTQVDSASQSFGSADNFGNGTRTIRIRKSYWTQANPTTGAKPIQNWVDAYELAYHVNAPGAPLLANPGTAPAPTTTTLPPLRAQPGTAVQGATIAK
jgi:hypothetical protein